MTVRLRIALLALVAGLFTLAGCQKDGADSSAAKSSADSRAPLMLPATQSDDDWKRYIGQMVSRNVRVKRGIPPFAVYVSPDEDPFPVIDNARQTLQRGVVKDTIIAFGSRDSQLMATQIVELFTDIPADRLKGARVVFVGDAAHRALAEGAVTPSGAEFIFLEVGK
jgi:hypothetical protein